MHQFNRFITWKIAISTAFACVLQAFAFQGVATAQTTVVTTATKFVVLESPFAIAGLQTPVEVLALDARDRLVRNFSGPADVTNTDPAAVFPASVTFTNGRANLVVTYNTGGSRALTVTSNANPLIFGSATTNVSQNGGPTHIAVLLSPLTVTNRATIGQLIARTNNNRVLTTYNGLANVSSTDPAATFPATVQFHHGVAVLKITFKTQGSQTVNIVDSTNTSLVGSQSTAVGTP